MRFLLLALSCTLLAHAQTSLDMLVDEFYGDYFHYYPSEGTAAGFHQYDSLLENYSRQSIRSQVDMFNRYLSEFGNRPASDDRDLVISKIQSQLLTLENIRPWAKNPDFYSSSATSSIFSLVSRKFAPPQNRLLSVIA